MRVDVISYGGAPESFTERFQIELRDDDGVLIEIHGTDIWNRQHANFVGKAYAEEKGADFYRCGVYRTKAHIVIACPTCRDEWHTSGRVGDVEGCTTCDDVFKIHTEDVIREEAPS